MSFRDSVKDNTKSVMIQTFITSLFSAQIRTCDSEIFSKT